MSGPRAADLLAALRAQESDDEKAKIARYYKGGPGTRVIGVRMRHTFDAAKAHRHMDLDEVEALLDSAYYEARMGAVSILDFKARRPSITDQERYGLYELYLRRHDRIDNWDLVDRAAPRVVGWYLLDKPRRPLYDLAASPDVWERRTAITASFWLVRRGDIDDALALAELLLEDDEEWVNKPVGTALREIGKVDADRLGDFIARHGARMPRVTLRYALERFAPTERAALRERFGG